MKAYKAKSGATQYKQSFATLERAANAGNVGFCLACGKKVAGCEPDMRKGECPHCAALKVYGAEEMVLMGLCY